MTVIKIIKEKNNFIKLECSGHTGYAEAGKDIVCSAISTLLGSCLLGLEKVVKIKTEHKQDEKKGFFSLELKKDISKNKMKEAQILLKSTVLSLIEISETYKNFITVQIIGEWNEIY